MNQLNIRTTFDDNGVADSHEIKFNKYRLLAYKYNKYGSQIEAWDKKNNCILRTIIYTPVNELKYTTLKIMMISAIDSVFK